MELKLSSKTQFDENVTAFNRTKMELKLYKLEASDAQQKPFNRTKMELKPQINYGYYDDNKLLIVPKWN